MGGPTLTTAVCTTTQRLAEHWGAGLQSLSSPRWHGAGTGSHDGQVELPFPGEAVGVGGSLCSGVFLQSSDAPGHPCGCPQPCLSLVRCPFVIRCHLCGASRLSPELRLQGHRRGHCHAHCIPQLLPVLASPLDLGWLNFFKNVNSFLFKRLRKRSSIQWLTPGCPP